MQRRTFLKQTALASTTFFIPNVVLALGNTKKNTVTILASEMLMALQKIDDYKLNTDGEVFTNTQLSFKTVEGNTIKLPQSHYIRVHEDGYGSPCMYTDGEYYYVFVNELFKAYLMNGYIYRWNSTEGFTKIRIYQQENMGWYPFWGKLIDGKPAFYHYCYSRRELIRSFALSNDLWETGRIYNENEYRAIELYNYYRGDKDQISQAKQFNHTYPKIKDGFYQYLWVLDRYKQIQIQEEKNKTEQQELNSPTVLSSKQTKLLYRELRNRQCIANIGTGCGCVDVVPNEPNESHIRIAIIYDLQTKKTDTDNNVYYKSSLSFYDRNNQLHKLADTIYLSAASTAVDQPKLYFDVDTYYLLVTHIDNKERKYSLYAIKENEIDLINTVANKPLEINEIQYPISIGHNIVWKKIMDHFVPPLIASTAWMPNANGDGSDNLLPSKGPYQPIYCEGDEIPPHLVGKVTIYKEVPGSRIEIPNMPPYETQNYIGACVPFAMKVLLQHNTCQAFKLDANNIPNKYRISSFGMFMITHEDKEIYKTFDPYYDASRIKDSIRILNDSKMKCNYIIPDKYKPFQKLVDEFNRSPKLQADGDRVTFQIKVFMDKMKEFYTQNKKKQDAQNTIDYPVSLAIEISDMVGNTILLEDIKQYLVAPSFDEFLYKLFFKKCERIQINDKFEVNNFPHGSSSSDIDLKNKIIEILKKEKPIAVTICDNGMTSIGTCHDNIGHELVVDGYRKVFQPDSKINWKDSFKIHNCFGDEWQKKNNKGWVDADSFIASIPRFKYELSQKFRTDTLVWLEDET